MIFYPFCATIRRVNFNCRESVYSLVPRKDVFMAKEEAKEIIDTPVEEVTEEKFAKAGKKSKKHVEEVKAEEERQARKAERAAEPEKKVGPRPVTRSRLERRGKNYRKANEKVEKNKAYSLEEAVKLAVATSPVKFDATLEMHFRLGVDPRQADQNIRATVTLPAGTGKDVRVAVFAPLDIAKFRRSYLYSAIYAKTR